MTFLMTWLRLLHGVISSQDKKINSETKTGKKKKKTQIDPLGIQNRFIREDKNLIGRTVVLWKYSDQVSFLLDLQPSSHFSKIKCMFELVQNWIRPHAIGQR